MANVKVPALLHKMSKAAQKAWYKKNNMTMPSEVEGGGRSAAAAKRVVAPAPRKQMAAAPQSVRAMNTARQQAYYAKGGRQPIGAGGSGGSSSMAGVGQSSAKEIIKGIKAGYNPKVALVRYTNEEAEQVDEVTKKEAEETLGGPVKTKPKMPPGKQPEGYRYVRALARRAMKAGLKKEEVEQVDEADVKSKPVLHKGKSIGETGIDTEASPGGGEWYAKHHKSGMNTVGFDSRKKAEAEVRAAHGIKEEVEQVDEARRMSAAEKLGRAFDSEQQRSALSRQRGLDLLKQKDTEKMQNKPASGDMTKLKKEEIEESTMKYIEEKLTAADPASKWISDFVKSDNPKFAGKSKKERIQQALGAYYAKKRGTNEEVELDESHGAEKLGDMLESDADHETKMKRIKIAPTAHLKYLHKYNMGYSGGGDHPMIKHIKDELKNRKMKNEEVEQIYEGKAHDRITAGLKDENKNVRVDAILHPKATPEHISIALKDEHPHVREAAIRHRNATPEHISAALKDDHMSVRKAAIKNRNASSENISAALKDGDIYTRMNAIKHRNVKPEHIAIALKDKESYVRDAAKNRMKKEEVFTEEESIEEAKQVDHAKTVANSLAATHPNFRVSSYNGDHGRAHVVHHKSDTRNFKNGEQLMGPNIQLQHNHETNKVHMEMQGDYDNVPDRDEETHHPDKAHAAAHKMFKPAIDLIHKTDKKTTNEEVEQMDEGIILEGNLSIRALYNKYADHYTSSEGNSAKRADAVEKTITKVHGPEVMNHLKKAVKANLRNDMDQEENHFERARNAAEKSGSDRVNATVGKNRSKFRKEEVVLEEPKDAADVGEYDYEGDMAKSQLRSIMANSKRMHDMLEDTTNLPEWVQSKITLAEDYVVTAANYMESEMNEAVRGYIQSEPGSGDGTSIRRPADQAERDQLARNLIANRKYNTGKKIGRKSGSVRSNAAGMTPSQKISTALRSPEASKKLGPKEFP